MEAQGPQRHAEEGPGGPRLPCGGSARVCAIAWAGTPVSWVELREYFKHVYRALCWKRSGLTADLHFAII